MLQPSLLLASFLLIPLASPSAAHGGSYRGPGDTVPGGGTGGGGSGPTPTPTPSQPGPTPGRTGTGSTPAPALPGQVPTGSSPGASVPTGLPGSAEDLTRWEYWWVFNQAQYLNLKASLWEDLISNPEGEFLDGQSKAPKPGLRPTHEDIHGRVVPALRQVLRDERSNDIVSGALIALAKIGDARDETGTSAAEETLRGFLDDPQQELAETAAVALGILASDVTVPALAHLALDDAAGRALVDDTEVALRTRAFAAYGLGLIGARTNSNAVRQDVARVLIEILRGPQTATRDVQVAALIALGLTPVDVAAADERGTGAAASRRGQIDFVLGLLEDERRPVLLRAHAPRALGQLARGTDEATRARVAQRLLELGGTSTGSRVELRQALVLALGQFGDADEDELDRAVRARLIELVERESEPQTRAFAAIALGQVGGRAGAGAGNAGGASQARAVLQSRLVRGPTGLRPWAGIALGVLERSAAQDARGLLVPSSASLQALRSALVDARSPDDVGALAIACGLTRDPQALEPLLAKLEQTAADGPRGYVALALGMVGDRRALAEVRKVVAGAKYKPELLQNASIALGLLGDKELVPELCTLLGEARGLSSQAAIASALGFIGDRRSIDPLVAMLRDERDRLTEGARGFAAVALGIVADKELLPWNSKISTDIDYRANTSTLTGEGAGILDIL